MTSILRTPAAPRKGDRSGRAAAWTKVRLLVTNLIAPAKDGSATARVVFGANEVYAVYAHSVVRFTWVKDELCASGRIDVNDGEVAGVYPLPLPATLVVLCVEGSGMFEACFGNDRPRFTPISPAAFPHVYVSGDYVVGASADGVLAVYSRPGFHPHPLSGTKVKLRNDNPMVSLSGLWIAYIPVEAPPAPLTPMRLPPRGPLFNRVLELLSAATIDGVVKLLAVSSRRLREYLASDLDLTPEVQPQGNPEQTTTSPLLRTALSNLLFPDASRSSSRVTIQDLKAGVLARFTPPGGTSVLSLSPHDCHVVTASRRGDHLYIWDLSRTPSHVLLVGKCKRGKTAAAIDRVVWSPHDEAVGVVTRAAGLLHWFPTHLNDDASRAWVLLSMGVGQVVVREGGVLYGAVGETIVAVSTTDGECRWKYDLPSEPVAVGSVSSVKQRAKSMPEAPLSQAEIETCFPYRNLFNDRKVLFCPMGGSQALDLCGAARGDYLAAFGDAPAVSPGFGVTVLTFGRGTGTAEYCEEAGTDQLAEALADTLVFETRAAQVEVLHGGLE